MIEDTKELQEYEESLKAYRDWYSVTKTSFDKGVAEGIQQGLAEGIQQGRVEGIQQGRVEGITEGIKLVAKKLKAEGWDLEEIAKVTSLPISVIEDLC